MAVRRENLYQTRVLGRTDLASLEETHAYS